MPEMDRLGWALGTKPPPLIEIQIGGRGKMTPRLAVDSSL